MTKATKKKIDTRKKTQKEKASLNSKNKRQRKHSFKTTALDCTLFSKNSKINRIQKKKKRG